MDVAKAVTEIKGGKIEFRVDKHANLHFIIGKTSFDDERSWCENYAAALDEVLRLKPSAAKGRYMQEGHLLDDDGPRHPGRPEQDAQPRRRDGRGLTVPAPDRPVPHHGAGPVAGRPPVLACEHAGRPRRPAIRSGQASRTCVSQDRRSPPARVVEGPASAGGPRRWTDAAVGAARRASVPWVRARSSRPVRLRRGVSSCRGLPSRLEEQEGGPWPDLTRQQRSPRSRTGSGRSSAAVLTEYRGLTVSQLTQLRRASASTRRTPW